MSQAQTILEHLRNHTYVLSELSEEDIGARVTRALESGWGDTLLPAYQTFDGTESDSLKATLLSLSNLTKMYYFVVVPNNQPFELDEMMVHNLLDNNKSSHMWLNAFRAISPETRAEIGRWVKQEATYIFSEGEPLWIFRINRS